MKTSLSAFFLALLALPGQAAVSSIPPAVISYGNPLTGDESRQFVQSVQRMLAKAGYLKPGETGGRLDDGTIEAIKRFERANGLPEDGRLTSKVFELLARKTRE